jgi:CheW-like protein
VSEPCAGERAVPAKKAPRAPARRPRKKPAPARRPPSACRPSCSRSAAARAGWPIETRIIVVSGEDGAAGLIVGDVREVITVAPEQLDQVKVTNDPPVTAIAKLGERLVVLLDASAALVGVEPAPARRPG